MPHYYSNPDREADDGALPDVETFLAYYGNCPDCGELVLSPDCTRGAHHPCDDRVTPLPNRAWFWWTCLPGCLPDGDASGPFDTEAEALADAREGWDG